ncbi:hypothetical protein E5288_WYG006860 [Bos mutus]|uniref:Uncharacterized protein n=1 Tax=Bos mutus TaxID=72004 RepID=A0A6B0QTP2_9CETA|nr:hypothetical protein [Bos mutus]
MSPEEPLRKERKKVTCQPGKRMAQPRSWYVQLTAVVRFVRCGPCAQGRERDAAGAKVQSAGPAGACSRSCSERNSLYGEQPGDVRCDSKPGSLMLLILVPFKV